MKSRQGHRQDMDRNAPRAVPSIELLQPGARFPAGQETLHDQQRSSNGVRVPASILTAIVVQQIPM
jgi:hypothetical protein